MGIPRFSGRSHPSNNGTRTFFFQRCNMNRFQPPQPLRLDKKVRSGLIRNKEQSNAMTKNHRLQKELKRFILKRGRKRLCVLSKANRLRHAFIRDNITIPDLV